MDTPTLIWDSAMGRQVGRTHFRLRYAETDRMGIAYNAHYLTWFEVGRTEFMRSTGMSYREVETRGFNLPLVDAQLKLRSSVGYDDILVTETWVAELRSRTITFAYRIRLGERVVAEGRTTHACMRSSDGRGCRIPPWLAERIDRTASTSS